MVYSSAFSLKSHLGDQSLHNFLFSNPQCVAEDHLLYIDADNNSNTLTYNQVQTQILKCAAGMRNKWNLKYGEVVAICSPNHINYPIILHGTVCAGGIATAIHYESGVEKIASDLSNVQAKFLIAHPKTLEDTLAAAKRAGLPLENIFLFGDESMHGLQTVEQAFLNGKDLATPYPYTPEQIQNDPAFLYFTSGTTGVKKAVVITQSIMINTLSARDTFFPVGTRTLGFSPFHHASSLITVLHLPIYAGYTTYVMGYNTFENVCSVIEKYKINVTTTRPYIVAALAKDSIAQSYDLSSLDTIFCAGSTLGIAVTLAVKDRIGLNVINLYGMTEAIHIFNSDKNTSLLNGVGYLAPGYTAKLVDEHGNEVPEGNIGELLIKGPTVTPGYYRNPEATAKVIDAEGYLHTGDLLKCNEAGMFTYLTRYKDLIKYFNTHILPTSIENVLMAHPKVADCAVIGVYSPELVTEIPRAYILLNKGETHSKETVDELEEYSNSKLADAMKLRGGIIIVDCFPRTPSGKIQRQYLSTEVSYKITV